MRWPALPFDEVVEDVTGGNVKTLQSGYLAEGKFPIIDQGQKLIGGYTNDVERLCKSDLPVVVFGDHTKSLKYVDFPFCLGADGTKILKAKPEADPRYLYYFLQTVQIPDAGYSRHFKYLKKAEIPLPPLEEQKRFAAILDQADALRRLRSRALDHLHALGQAVFHEMFGDKAAPTLVRPLADLLDVRSSLDDPRLPENSALLHVGPEHISSGSGVISWERVRSCHEDGVQSGKYHFQSGDIIFSKIRPNLNKVAIADRQGMCSADMYALVPDREQMTTEFLHFILGGKDFLKYAETVSNRANIPKLNRSQLLAFQCPVPELASQRQFSDRIALIQNTAQEALQHQSTTQSLFASLQDRAFRGEL